MKIHHRVDVQHGPGMPAVYRRRCLGWKDTEPENVTYDITKVTCKKCLSMVRGTGRGKLILRLKKWRDSQEQA